jgi:hypothetical protein
MMDSCSPTNSLGNAMGDGARVRLGVRGRVVFVESRVFFFGFWREGESKKNKKKTGRKTKSSPLKKERPRLSFSFRERRLRSDLLQLSFVSFSRLSEPRRRRLPLFSFAVGERDLVSEKEKKRGRKRNLLRGAALPSSFSFLLPSFLSSCLIWRRR